MRKKAKIIATIGPSSSKTEIIEKMILAGMNVARLNFSHGTHNEHEEHITQIRKISRKLNLPITILQDLQGTKLRVGELPSNGLFLKSGQTARLLREENIQIQIHDNNLEIKIPLDIPDFHKFLHPGSRILLKDGQIELVIEKITRKEIKAKVIQGGILFSNQGVNLPGVSLNVRSFTEKDKSDLLFGLDHSIDMVALSFVHDAQDIRNVRKFIREHEPQKSYMPIIAKLELPEAIQNLESIIEESDGVMVARGDLGVETSYSAIPIIQKEIIDIANMKCKYVITATQMLESMIENPRPTRAETSDVANAVLDGTDALMLSGETAKGEYPVESVETMNSIIVETETHYQKWGHDHLPSKNLHLSDPLALSLAARELAHNQEVSCIAVFTQTGRSAIFQSKARPQVPIFAFTPVKSTYQRLGMYWGVYPYLVPYSNSLEDMINCVEETILTNTDIQEGQKVVVISGFPINALRPANLALLHTIQKRK